MIVLSMGEVQKDFQMGIAILVIISMVNPKDMVNTNGVMEIFIKDIL